MAIEQTLILCKGDAVARGLVGEILSRFENRGYAIFKDLVEYITSAPIVALVVRGSDAIEGCRVTIGATNPIKAAAGTIRGDFAQTIGRNLVHGSDSPASAEREIPIWFEPHEIFARDHALDTWLVSN
jgi:nucleoside-diphosphate kinase